jgi:hypothetical protein
MALIAASGTALSEPNDNASDQAKAISAAKIEKMKARAKSGPMAKMSPHLSELVVTDEAAAATVIKEPGEVIGPLRNESVPMVGEMVVVDIATAGDSAALLAELEGLGLQQGTAFGRIVSGLLPVSALPDVAGLGAVASIQPAAAMTNVGLVTSRGDVSMKTDEARADFGIDGTGVRVGVLSDGFNCRGGAAADQASGDLPADIIVLQDLPPGTCSDEGRAMMQIVADVAPGASQAFHTAFTGQAGFAQGIIDLQEVAGSSVIVDDVIYFAEPMFQDGIIAQAADQVRANGATYFSSAGNNERNSYESEFRPSGEFGVFGCERHDFDPGPGVQSLQTFLVTPGSTRWSFQWSQPAFSVSGPPGASSDLDIVLYDAVTEAFIGIASIGNNIGGDPIEFLGVGLGGTNPVPVKIGLEKCAGPSPELIKYVYFGSDRRFGAGVLEFDTASATSYGHANAAGAVGTGASAWFNTAAFNDNPLCDPACLNGFSSVGGIPILYDTAGNPVYDLRPKPEIVGPDGANNTFFGFDLSFPVPGTNEPDGFPNFFGTSASAPHIAGVAALMSQPTVDGQHFYVCNPLVPGNKTQRVGPNAAAVLVAKGATYGVCAGDIVDAMIATAIDMDDFFTPEFDEGFDNATGAGFIDAREAIGVVYRQEKTD